MPRLALLVESDRPPRVTAVGDVVSRETFLARIPVNLRIVDQRSLRSPVRSLPDFSAKRTYRVRNPAGVITAEAMNAIKRAMKESSGLILVDGEEDLLTLPCIAESPDGALVLYGQPSEGLVVVTVTAPLKDEVALIMKRMQSENVT